MSARSSTARRGSVRAPSRRACPGGHPSPSGRVGRHRSPAAWRSRSRAGCTSSCLGSPPTEMLLAFRSRWMTPAAWAADSTEQVGSRISSVSAGDSRPRRSIRLFKVLGRDQLHHDVGTAIGQRARIEHLHDARVLDEGHDLGFPLEPQQGQRGRRLLAQQDLDGHAAGWHAGRLGGVDRPATPRAQSARRPGTRPRPCPAGQLEGVPGGGGR